MKFQSAVVLPVSKKTILASQLRFGDYIELQKCLQNDDQQIIEKYIEGVIEEYCDLPINNVIDKLVVILFIRIISVGSMFVYEETGQTYNVDLLSFLNELLGLSVPTTMVAGDTVNISLPVRFIHTDQFDLTRDCVDNKTVVYEDLPASFTHQCLQYIETINAELSKIKFRYHRDHPAVELSLFDNSLLEVIRVLFADNLQNCFQKMYSLVSSARFSPEYILTLPPAEIEVYLSILKENNTSTDETPGVDMPKLPVNNLHDSV